MREVRLNPGDGRAEGMSLKIKYLDGSMPGSELAHSVGGLETTGRWNEGTHVYDAVNPRRRRLNP